MFLPPPHKDVTNLSEQKIYLTGWFEKWWAVMKNGNFPNPKWRRKGRK